MPVMRRITAGEVYEAHGPRTGVFDVEQSVVFPTRLARRGHGADRQVPAPGPECINLTAEARDRNQLLASLPPEDFERWVPRLDRVALPAGRVLHESGDAAPFVVFPLTALVSLRSVTGSGEFAEVGLTGNDGYVGAAPFPGCQTVPSQAVVLTAGAGYRFPSDLLHAEVARGGAVLRMLLCHSQALLAQIAQTAVCNRHHTLHQRLCRWLLTAFDRVAADALPLEPVQLAEALAVTPERTAQALADIAAQGAIGVAPQRLVLGDRPRLEALACECHGVAKTERERVMAAA